MMWRRMFDRLVLAYFVYYVLVGLVGTVAIDHYGGTMYRGQTGRSLEYQWAGVNPFTLAIYIYGARDTNPDGSVLWSADELAVNPSLWGTLFGKGFVLDEIRVRSLYLHLGKLQDGQWGFADILSYRDELAKNDNPVTDDNQQENSADGGLPGISIAKINFNAKFLGYSDASRPEPFDASLEDISFELSDFSTLIEEGQPYRFKASDEAGGELEWQGTLSLLGASSAGRLDLRGISLLPAYRYLKSEVNFELHSAQLELGGDYTLSWKDPDNPEYSIQNGHLALKSVNLTPNDDTSSGLSLETFAINRIAVDGKRQTVYSPEGQLSGLRGTVSVLQNGETNFNTMFAVNPAANTAESTPHSRRDAESAKTETAPWSVQLDTIKVENTEFFFNDYSITPNFSVFIKEFGGSVDNISTAKESQTTFALAGKADAFAPVTLTGNVSPGREPLMAHAAFDFKGIDLTSFSPYSGTFAGRKISKGLLSVNLDYTLSGGLVNGKNHVVVDQLTLGERVKSPRIIDLPLQLALALLTDKDGVIDLNVDVSGDADNPDFSVGKIIWGAFKNLIVKAVTAPFRFLANLIGADDDFEFIAFDVASSALPGNSQSTLDKLIEALSKRPQIRVGIAGLYGDQDVRHFKVASLRLKPEMDHLADSDLAERNARFDKAVTRLFKKSFPDQEPQPISAMYDALIDAEPLPQEPLQQLAQARALAVKQYLIETGHADPQRVFLQADGVEDRAEAVKLIAE